MPSVVRSSDFDGGQAVCHVAWAVAIGATGGRQSGQNTTRARTAVGPLTDEQFVKAAKARRRGVLLCALVFAQLWWQPGRTARRLEAAADPDDAGIRRPTERPADPARFLPHSSKLLI
jgi:hypothetical protein